MSIHLISPQMAANKLIPIPQEQSRVHRKWASSLRSKACLQSLLIKPRLIPVMHTDDIIVGTGVQLAWTTARSRPQQDCQQTRRLQRQITNCNTNCMTINLVLQKNFCTNKHFGTACVKEMDHQDLRVIIIHQQPVLGQEHQSSEGHEYHHMHGLANNQLLLIRHSCDGKSCNTLTIRGDRTQPFS